MHITNAAPAEQSAALELALNHISEDIRPARLLNALALLALRQIDPEGIFVACDASGMRGVVIAVPLPGASGLFWLPKTNPVDTGLEDQLVQVALAWLRRLGTKVAQAIVASVDVPRLGPLLRAGFRFVTRLHYLEHSLDALPHLPASSIRFTTYSGRNREAFHATLLRTYEGSLDCPELNGVRTIDEIIAGHKAQGAFDPNNWWLALAGGRPVGIAVVARVADLDAWDLSYVGVVPEERRRGVGRELVAHVLHKARQAGEAKLILAVDARNEPALQLYQQLGFVSVDFREIYLYFWHLPLVNETPTV